jgi:hypothetical protein
VIFGEPVGQQSHLLGLQVEKDMGIVLSESSQVIKVGFLSESEFLSGQKAVEGVLIAQSRQQKIAASNKGHKRAYNIGIVSLLENIALQVDKALGKSEVLGDLGPVLLGGVLGGSHVFVNVQE